MVSLLTQELECWSVEDDLILCFKTQVRPGLNHGSSCVEVTGPIRSKPWVQLRRSFGSDQVQTMGPAVSKSQVRLGPNRGSSGVEASGLTSCKPWVQRCRSFRSDQVQTMGTAVSKSQVRLGPNHGSRCVEASGLTRSKTIEYPTMSKPQVRPGPKHGSTGVEAGVPSWFRVSHSYRKLAAVTHTGNSQLSRIYRNLWQSSFSLVCREFQQV